MKKNSRANTPLVSVIMPVYNAGAFLVESIQSIVNQTYKNLELIIVDDASADDSWQIITMFQKRYPRKICAIRLKTNLNQGGDACANVAFNKSRGEFVARMDADDVAHPDRIAKQVAYLQKHPAISLLGSQAFLIDKNGKQTGEKRVPLTHAAIYNQYFTIHPMIHPTVMIRKNALKSRKQLYQIKYSANNDYLTFFELINSGTFANLKEKLLYYRVHGKNDSLTHLKERFFNTLKIRRDAIVDFGYRPTLKNLLIVAGQTAFVSVVPERFLYVLYFYMRGLYKPTIQFTSLSPSLKPLRKLAYRINLL